MADALDSKSSDRKIVWVQVPPPALMARPSGNCKQGAEMKLFYGIVLLATGACSCALVYFCKVPENLEFLRGLAAFFGIVSLLVGLIAVSEAKKEAN
jgi:hypothetical protein